MRLFTVEVLVANVAEQTLVKLSLGHGFDASEIEDRERFSARKVTPVRQVALDFLDLLLQVNLV